MQDESNLLEDLAEDVAGGLSKLKNTIATKLKELLCPENCNGNQCKGKGIGKECICSSKNFGKFCQYAASLKSDIQTAAQKLCALFKGLLSASITSEQKIQTMKEILALDLDKEGLTCANDSLKEIMSSEKDYEQLLGLNELMDKQIKALGSEASDLKKEKKA